MALVAQWKMQDNAASTTVVATVGTNAALLGGDNTSVLSVSGGPGTAIPLALDLDGTADYIDISGSSLSYATTVPWTFCGWFKADALGSNRPLWGQDGASPQRAFTNSTGTNLTVTGTAGNSIFTFASAISTGTWYHIAVTRSAANAVRVFVDGVESTTGAITVAQTFSFPRIGRSTTTYWSGPIADVRVYNSDESLNLAAIMAEKNTSGGGSVLPIFYNHYRQQGII